MDMVLSILIYVGVLVVSLLVVLLPMRWLARRFDAGRSGYLYCFLALVVPYFVVGLLLAGAAMGLGLAGLTPEPLIMLGVFIVAVLIGLALFARILDTTFLRGVGIAVCSTIATWVITAILGTVVAVLGIGGASMTAVQAMLDNPEMLTAGPMAEAESSRDVLPPSPGLRKLRGAVNALCDCVEAGRACRNEQRRLTALIDTPEAVELNRSFARITDQATRRRLTDLIRSVADNSDSS